MRKFFIFSLFLLLFFFFALASQSIVGVKLQELRFGILRDQLMNYELSSQTLRERLKQMFLSKDDYLQEVKVNILESGIMNSETKGVELEMGWRDRFGLGVINAVRALNFKPFLELEEQQKTIIRLQFAFYMERTRKFSIASKKYDELEEMLNGSLADEHAFTLLHHGYCLVMMGEREKAFVKLRKTIDLFPGTHYAENAELLISFLVDGDKRKLEFENSNQNPQQRAIASFQAGDYESTLKTLEALPVLTNDQSYIKARSMEELGKTSNAVKEYIQLVKQKENKEVAIRANRRLLLIGNFYQENKSLVAFSKSEATKLGDDKAVAQIEEGKSLVLKPIIVEKILNAESSNTNSPEAKELEEIKDSLKESLVESKIETQKMMTVVEEEKIPLVKEEAVADSKVEEKKIEEIKPQIIPIKKPIKPIAVKLQVRMNDGRTVVCDSLTTDGALANLNLGAFTLSVPLEMISVIKTSGTSKNKRMIIESGDGEKQEGDVLKRNEEGIWLSKEGKEEIRDSNLKEIRVQ
jgi:tetratricopeptide (TPR) repeat protein